MKTVYSIYALFLLNIALILLLSCCRKNAPQQSTHLSPSDNPTITSLLSPKSDAVITCSDSVRIEFTLPDPDVHIDSVAVLTGNKTSVCFQGEQHVMYWSSRQSRVGQVTLRIVFYYNDSLTDSHNVSLVVLSDIIPEKYSYRTVRQYPHDNQAYTQGLFYHDGYLYESTGLEGKSSLRIVDITTGKPSRMVNLSPQYFGEGIALYNDQVYQITYKSQVGFIYDKKTLGQIRSFDYQIKEGWGLTTDGQNLIMSDGSAQLYVIEPEFFTQTDKIEVFDNKGMISMLNEIEFIKGNIWANVYGESYIIIIEKLTGKVIGKVELKDLMPSGTQGDYGKVLNGIAYNPQTGHLYVTGKDWPVLFEIETFPCP